MIACMRVLALALVVTTPACRNAAKEAPSDGATVAEQSSRVRIAPSAAPAPPMPSSGAEAARGFAQAPPAQEPAPATTPIPRMLTRSGRASIRVDKVEPALRAVRAIAQRVGGYVAGESVQTGEDEVKQGTLQLKIPSRRFDEAVNALQSVGKVESVEISSEDVGQEFVDVSARLANARRLEERLLNLLQTRTGKLEDVLAVERELARVREEIERMTARVQYLQRQVDVSTLLVQVHEPAPITGATPGTNPILDAFRQAWRNFVGFIAGFIALLGVLIPLIALVALVWWAAGRRWFRSRRERQEARKVPSASASPSPEVQNPHS